MLLDIALVWTAWIDGDLRVASFGVVDAYTEAYIVSNKSV